MTRRILIFQLHIFFSFLPRTFNFFHFGVLVFFLRQISFWCLDGKGLQENFPVIVFSLAPRKLNMLHNLFIFNFIRDGKF